MLEVGKLFASYVVLFISNANKFKVPMGLDAANLQTPILMHLEDKVRLPDHNLVVGTQRNLIPSVYRLCDINLKVEVTYS